MRALMRAAVLALCAALLAIGRGAGAQTTCTVAAAPGSCTASTGATLTVGKIVQLTLGSTASVIPVPADSDYTNGWVTLTGQTVTVRSNANVVVTVRAAAANWTATNTVVGVTARAAKPSTDLQIATSAAGPFTGLTTAPFTLVTSGATAGTTIGIVHRVLLSWTLDTPGQYALDVVYTVTAP